MKELATGSLVGEDVFTGGSGYVQLLSHTLAADADLFVDVHAPTLSGNGDTEFSIDVKLDGVECNPWPEGSATWGTNQNAHYRLPIGPVPSGTQVVISVHSSDSDDTSEDVTGTLYDVSPLAWLSAQAMPGSKTAGSIADELHRAKAVLANARTHVVETGVNTIKENDGVTDLLTLTPTETDGIVSVTPSE
jgi:hypothetical protein